MGWAGAWKLGLGIALHIMVRSVVCCTLGLCFVGQKFEESDERAFDMDSLGDRDDESVDLGN